MMIPHFKTGVHALMLSAPAQVLCREDCRGLCPVCAIELNDAPEGHTHEPGMQRLKERLEKRFDKMRGLLENPITE